MNTFAPNEVLTAEELNETFAEKADGSHSHTTSSILDMTAAGRSLVTANGVEAQKAVLQLAKGDVGLSEVDNTADINKPLSSAAQEALDGKAALGHHHPAEEIDSGSLAPARFSATLSAALDAMVGASATGDTLYRGPNGWLRVTAGPIGYLLTSLGPGNLPQWVAPVVATVPNSVIPTNSVLPSISPVSAKEGTTLTLNPGTWTGTPSPSFIYQWFIADLDTPIPGATGTSYVATATDVGHKLRCDVTGYNSAGAVTKSSAWTDTITASNTTSTPSPQSAATVSGTPKIGTTLTASTGTWSGVPAPSFSFQWYWADTNAPIANATSPTYVPVASDYNHTLKVGVTGSNGVGSPSTIFSAPTAAVAGIAPSPSVAPSVTPTTATGGTSTTGTQLVSSIGSWSGTPTPTFGYQWYYGDTNTPIAGATGATYTTLTADVGHFVFCRVTATNGAGSATSDSNWVQVSAASQVGVAPSPTSSPVVSGAPQVGVALTATPGTWNGSPTPTFAYQWYWADTNALISGATANSYTPVTGDIGHTLKVVVTGTNSVSTGSATSSATAAVIAAAASDPNATIPSLISPPTVTGTPIEGATLTLSGASWSEAPAPATSAPANVFPPTITGTVATGSTLSLLPPTIDPLNLATTAQLAFSDEFTNLSLYDGASGTWNSTQYWSSNPEGYSLNDALSLYVSSRGTIAPQLATKPWSVANSILSLTAQRTPSNLLTLAGKDYLSGALNSYYSFSQLYGYWEIRCKAPTGNGWWPAFWLLPADGSWPPEIDIFEWYSTQPTVTYMTVHSQASGSHTSSTITPTPTLNLADGSFHTIGLDWTATSCKFYADGVLKGTLTTPSDFNKAAYMLIDFAVGTNNPSDLPDSNTPFPSSFLVDYVRVYKAAASAWTGSPTPTLTYQWKRDGANISGATSPTYTVVSADEGHRLSVSVTGTNSVTSTTVTSAETALVPASGGGGTATWNPSDKSIWITLSNGNLTATKTSNVTGCLRSTTGYNNASDHIATITIDNLGNSGWFDIGLANASRSVDAHNFNGGQSLSYDVGDNTIYGSDGSDLGGGYSGTPGVGLAVRVRLNGTQCWFKLGADAETGPYSLSGLGAGPYYVCVEPSNGTGGAVTANFASW